MAQQQPCAPLDWEEEFQWLLQQMSAAIHTQTPTRRVHLARYLSLIALGGYLGPRAKELLHFRWSDVIGGKGRKVYEFKTGKQRQVYFNDKLLRLVESNFTIVDPLNIHEFILPSSDPGKPITTRGFNKSFRKLLEEFGIQTDNPSSHTLRKTFAYRIFEQKGGDEKALMLVSEILNHGDLATTRKYLGITRREIRKAYLELD